MKVCTFEPALSCQACSRAKLSTSSLLFDRAILFMSPLTVANYRLDGTVMRCAGENLSTGCDLPLACRKHRSHIPHNAWLILRRGNGCNRRTFFGQSPIICFFRQSQSICFAFRSCLFRVPEPAREQRVPL